MSKQKIEDFIEAYNAGDVSDEYLETWAPHLNRLVGQYLYNTDKDERPDGALKLKEKLDSILSERRFKIENARMEKDGVGQAAYSKHT